MKKFYGIMAVVIFLFCLLTGQGVAQTKTIVLKAFTNWPVTNNNVDGFKRFIQLVNERAKGELEIKLIGGPELISVKESVGALGRGMMDMRHSNNVHFAMSQAADIISSTEVAENYGWTPNLSG